VRPYKELRDERFGRLTVLKAAPSRQEPSGRWVRYWLCRCDCGSNIEVRAKFLLNGNTQSCGCLHRERAVEAGAASRTHGQSNSPTWRSWHNMRTRCNNINVPDYPRYGGRGITICPRWDTFENFLADMGERPDGMTLDRLDSNGNYEPTNCRWATQSEQGNNRSTNLPLSFDGRTQTMSQWARELGLPVPTLQNRLARGWSLEKALTTRSR